MKNLSNIEAMAWLKKISELGASPATYDDELFDMLLSHEDAIVRHEAAFIIGTFVRVGFINTAFAFTALRLACEDRSILVRHEAALALAAFPEEKVFEILLRLQSDASADVVASAKFAMSEIRSTKKP